MLGERDYLNIKYVFCDAFGKRLIPEDYYKTKIVEIYEETNEEFNLKKLQQIVIGKIITISDLFSSTKKVTLLDVDLQKPPETKLISFTPYGSDYIFVRLLNKNDLVVDNLEDLLEYMSKLNSKIKEMNTSVSEIKKLMYTN